MANRVTITDLAKAANVSVSTVDRILNRRGSVQRVTEEHVLTIAERIGFHAVPGLRRRLSETAPERTFGFLLNSKSRHLYAWLAALLKQTTIASPYIQGRAVVRHLEDMSPDSAAAALRELGEQCDAVAGVCIDHPRVNLAIAENAQRGVPFWAMLSDVSAPERAGFVGANGWKLGRSAGWFMHRLRPDGGKVAVLIGSSRYLCQQEFETGFRGFLREIASPIETMPTLETEESDDIAFSVTRRLLEEHPDLTGIFVAGGGTDGVTAALQPIGPGRVSVISTELSDRTRANLLGGLIDMALSHPAEIVAERVVRAMEAGAQHSGPLIRTVMQQIAISESI